MKKLAFDVDGILVDFTSKMAEVLNKYYNTNIPSNYKPTDWSWLSADLPRGVFSDVWGKIRQTNNFWYDLSPMPEMNLFSEYFIEHADRTAEFYFVTSRMETAGATVREQTESWLYEAMGSPHQTINVLVVHNPMDKVDVLHALHIDAFIDDHAPTVISTASLHNCRSYLYLQPWNEREARVYNIRSVSSLAEFFEQELGMDSAISKRI